jgi:uncharacterized protein YjiK
MDEPSGLALDPDKQHLWIVSDTKGSAYKTDLKGEIIEKIKIKGKDLEGIAINATADTIVVVDESKQSVNWYDLNGERTKVLKLNIAMDKNSGLEGIDIDPSTGDIYLVNEKRPRMLVKLKADGKMISQNKIEALSDISSVLYEPEKDRIWMMSDIDRKIMIFNKDLKPLIQIPIDIIQMEGMAVDFDKKMLYIISDKEEELHVFHLKI